MRLPFILFFIFTVFGLQVVQGQSTKRIIESHGRHRVSGSNFDVNIPPEFKPGKENQDEFVLQEKGSVIRFFALANVDSKTFCDSMTTAYFAAQQLRDVVQEKEGNVTVYKGKFDIERVPYIRAFYVIPDNAGTVLGIANYPEKLEGEQENQFVRMFKNHDDD